MKSLSQISRQPGRVRGEQSPVGLRLKHPFTDYHFHVPASEVQSAGSSRKLSRPIFAPGFRDLSNKFLGAETTRNYMAEVLFFAIIVGVSAWPVVSMVQALAHLMK
ncbi:MAG TPA: hypothetical protein VF345_11890 [Chthoniobacterales bacterium]